MRPRARWLAALTVGVPNLGLAFGVFDLAQRGPQRLELTLFGIFYVLCALGTEVGFHRLVSHRAFRASPATQVVLCALGAMAVQGTPLFWATVHRQHHARVDQLGDPHSPWHGATSACGGVRGFFHAHVGWLFTAAAAPWQPPIGDLLRDRLLVRLNALYPTFALLGIALPAAIGGAVTGSWAGGGYAAVWGGLVRVAVWQHVTWAVNSLGHTYGAQPFATHDHSRNNPWLVPFTLGGAWHNNHHAFPSSARVGLTPLQLDLHYALIVLLEWLGLASSVKRPNPTRLARAARATGGNEHDVDG